MTHPERHDPPLLRGLTNRRISRRDMLRYAGLGVGSLSVASFLAACGVGGTEDESPTAGRSPTGPSPTGSPTPGLFDGEPSGELNFANWPYYIDKAAGKYPSLELFTKETGIQVNYRPVINDNAEFLATVRPVLAQGDDTGWDIIVITNGIYLDELIQNGWLTALDHSKLPNFARYASPSVKDPTFDPGNQYSVAWQSGITGIGYNPELTGREITSFEDLFDPAFEGKVGMFGDNLDLPNFALLGIGVDPAESTPEDWQKAADKLIEQRDAGLVRKYYTQGYLEALGNGDLALSMAWSGDIFQKNAENPKLNLQFVIPDEGGILWTDNMMIPTGAQHPVDAITYMDFAYRPDVAALIADWVNYITPVPDAQPIIRDELKDPAVANSPLVFPKEEDLARTSRYRVLTPDELEQWNEIFQPVYQS